MASSKQHHFQGPYLRQNWLLPNSIIYYFTMNPTSSKAYKKLIKSCKYFFAKNPVLVIEKLFYTYDNQLGIVFDGQRKVLDLLSHSYKLWITHQFDMTFYDKISPNIFSSIFPRFYCFDAKFLCLCNQIISYNEFKFLSLNTEVLDLYYTVVQDKENSIVPFEKLVKNLQKIKKIDFSNRQSSSSITKNTVKELLELSFFSKIEEFTLYDIPETFDINTFFSYIKKNTHTKFYLRFCDSILESYQNRVEGIIDEIIATKNHVYIPPFMYFSNLSSEKYMKMKSIFEKPY